MLIGLVLQLLTFHSLRLKTTHGGMWCISDAKSRSAFSVVLIPETPGVLMLVVSMAWCNHVALIKFLSLATSLVVSCYNVNYCQWQHNTYSLCNIYHVYSQLPLTDSQ